MIKLIRRFLEELRRVRGTDHLADSLSVTFRARHRSPATPWPAAEHTRLRRRQAAIVATR